MRKLKFRFWLGSTMQGILELEQCGIIDVGWDWDSVDQYTGIEDEQGKEIYENDILNIVYDIVNEVGEESSYTEKGIVVEWNYSFLAKLEYASALIKISNIYENINGFTLQ